MTDKETSVRPAKDQAFGLFGFPSKKPSYHATNKRRDEERREYERQYQNSAYRMGVARGRDVRKLLARLAAVYGGQPGSFLDVSTGRGEALLYAKEFGFTPVLGTEVVPSLLVRDEVEYAEAHSLPFDDAAYDHVTCFDTLEHLVSEDVEPAIRELWRVARKTVTVSAATRPSIFGDRDLHISARSVEEWSATFSRVLGFDVKPSGFVGKTPCWRFVKA